MNFTDKHFDAVTKADIIDETDGTVIYYGRFKPGLYNYSQPNSRIYRIRQSGTVWIKEYADGNQNYDNVWNNRLILTYSHLQ